jgi:hypothetical protein
MDFKKQINLEMTSYTPPTKNDCAENGSVAAMGQRVAIRAGTAASIPASY